MPFLELPPEVIERVLIFCPPRCLAAISLACKALYALIYKSADHHLWRSVFLAQGTFDDPRETDVKGGFDWTSQVQQRAWAAAVAARPAHQVSPDECTKLQQIAAAVATQNVVPFPLKSRSIAWAEDILRGPIFAVASEANKTPLGYRLKALTGSAEGPALRLEARAFVYDLRNVNQYNHWGPLMKDGTTVNWRHIQYLQTVIQENLLAEDILRSVGPPTGLHNARPYSSPDWNERRPEDWAGVEGQWVRAICFMDYRDLFHYNFSEEALDTSIFENEDFMEACRIIPVEFKITSVDQPENPKYPDRPTLHFTGKTQPPFQTATQATSRGTVQMGQDEIIWKLATRVQGTVYSSVAVQLGNVGSASGFVGIWSAASHGYEDPAGPTWCWKIGH